MKRYFLFLVVFLLAFEGKSQVSEIGLCGGVSFYMGDLNPKGVFKGSRPAGGLVYRYNINPRLAVKAVALFGSMQASDADNGNLKRNLNFRSPLSELSAQMELNFMRLYNENGRNIFTPYLFVGVGIFSFNPQTELRLQWYDLQPLGTEGQDLNSTDNDTKIVYDQKRYSLTGVSIPFGLGARVNFLKYYSIGLEWGFRKTFTDYLDDVSGNYVRRDFLIEKRNMDIADLSDRTTSKLPDGKEDYHKAGSMRGNNSKTTDWYSFAVLTFTFKLNYSKDCQANTANPSQKKPKKPAR